MMSGIEQEARPSDRGHARIHARVHGILSVVPSACPQVGRARRTGERVGRYGGEEGRQVGRTRYARTERRRGKSERREVGSGFGPPTTSTRRIRTKPYLDDMPCQKNRAMPDSPSRRRTRPAHTPQPIRICSFPHPRVLSLTRRPDERQLAHPSFPIPITPHAHPRLRRPRRPRKPRVVERVRMGHGHGHP